MEGRFAEARNGITMSKETTEGRAPTSMAREILFFFLRFLGASIALYLLCYFFIGAYYLRLIAVLAKPMLSVFGYTFVMERVVAISESISLNPFVFLSLVIAVRHISLRRKLGAGVIGMAILVLANALTVTLAFVSSYRQSEVWWTGTEFLDLTNNFFMPILLWLILLPIRSAFPFIRYNSA